MHAVFFGSKRVHLEVVWRLTRPLLERSRSGLTPARFDLMRVVHMRAQGVLQRTLQWRLGVSAPTVSRMVKALEALGMVTRTRQDRDRRCLWVHITETGRRAVDIALAATVGVRADVIAVARCATGRNPNIGWMGGDEIAAFMEAAKPHVETLELVVARMRRALHDEAPPHPWSTVDCTPFAVHTFVDGRGRYGNEDLLDPSWKPPPIWGAPVDLALTSPAPEA